MFADVRACNVCTCVPEMKSSVLNMGRGRGQQSKLAMSNIRMCLRDSPNMLDGRVLNQEAQGKTQVTKMG